jgi:sugar phosphate isomerase/epimerase
LSALPFGISTHLYHDDRLGRDQLVEIAAHGFEAVEVFANRPHVDLADQGLMAELKEALADTGLRAHSVHAPIADSLRSGAWGTPLSLGTADDRARTSAVTEATAAIRLAYEIGATFVVVHVGVPDSQLRGLDDNRSDAARRSIEALEAIATPLGVRLALEVIPNRLSSPEQLVRLIEDDLELPGVGVCLDFGHAHLGGDVVDAIEVLSGHVATTHVHANHGRSDEHLLPFDGTIEWAAGLIALRKIGYEGALIFELAAAVNRRPVLERAQQVRVRLEQMLAS